MDIEAPYGRSVYGVPKRPNEPVTIRIQGGQHAIEWARYITGQVPLLDALPVPEIIVELVE